MSKITTTFPVAEMHGKVSKSDTLYLKTRKADGQVLAIDMRHPADNIPPTVKQSRAQNDLRLAQQQVKAILLDESLLAPYEQAYKSVDHRRYKTLRGYIFAQVYTQSAD